MTLAMHAFLHDKFIQLYGNLSTPVNTRIEQYCHRGMLTMIVNLIIIYNE